MVKTCGRCTWAHDNIDTGTGIARDCCPDCVVIIGGQQSYSNVLQYFLNKKYFSTIVLSRIKNRRYV